MINRKEIEEKSKEFEINTSNIQRDYVFWWILAWIYTISELRNYFILKWWNCLRKAYFESTRYSSDLDFAIETSLETEYIKEELNKICYFIEKNSWIKFDTNKTKIYDKKWIAIKDKKVLESKLFFKDFYWIESEISISIKLDITEFDKIFLPTQERLIIHPYSDYKDFQIPIKCLKLEEVLASKLKCLLQRRHSVDFYDYAYSLIMNNELKIDKSEIITTLLKSTIFWKSPWALKNLLIWVPFEIIKKLWNDYLVVPKHWIIDFENATGKFRDHINDLFLWLNQWNVWAFYPAEYRNKILDAWFNMTLLEICYKNEKRLIEPYSLTYKTTKEWIGKEYLYAFDKLRWEIRMYVQENIQDIQNTETEFEARYDVELKKSWEKSDKSFFWKPFSSWGKQTIKKAPRYKRVVWKTVYVFQCPVCKKKFRKNSYNGSLNNHKDKYWNYCYWWFWNYIETKYI